MTDWRENPAAVKITVTIADQERYDGDWPPEDAKGFLAWFASRLATVPEESRGTVQIEISSSSDYDHHTARIEITYSRLETADEVATRLAAFHEEQARRNAAEQQVFEYLKRKYEGNGR